MGIGSHGMKVHSLESEENPEIPEYARKGSGNPSAIPQSSQYSPLYLPSIYRLE